MKTIKRIIFLLLITLFSVTCKDILNISPQDRIAEDAVWSDANLIHAYQNELYNAIPHGFFIHMYSKYTDEAFDNAPCCGADLFKLNTYTPDNIAQAGGDAAGFWAAGSGYLYYWDRAYTYIRKINVFLDKMQKVTVTLTDKDQMIGEAKFLRAFIYFNLIERFGGVPIVDQVYKLGDVVQFTRSTFDQCVTFIEQDIAAAKAVLPDKYQSTDANFGRASGNACQALLSRLYLYAASPLFSPTKDLAKWQKAADAAQALLSKGYSLYPDYQKLFELSQGAANNEVIFSRGFTTANGQQAPMNNFNRRYEGYGGWWGSNGPSANLIDDYDMINGEPAFNADGTVNPTSGYDPLHPFKNRDPRFEATVLHDDMYFRGDHFEMWIAEDGKSWGYDSYKATGDNPRTNTVLLKFMPETGSFNWQTQFTIQWPYFRIAEIYLNYAEAKFELGDEATARQYVNLVRKRASVNLPDIPATVTGEELRRRIYNERRIELAFESHRFFDVRRWKIGTKVENAKTTTYDVFLNVATGVKRYEKVVLLDRSGTFQDYKSLLPIAQDEMRRNTGLTQTPGYN